MTKYLPKHLATRHGRVESARVGAAAARGSRSALALGVGATLPVAGSNSPYALLTHCLGAMRRWSSTVNLGGTVPRDRDAEFTATGPVSTLVERAARERQAFIDDVAATDLDALPVAPPADRVDAPARSYQVTDCRAVLLHVVEELAQHLGHLEITRDVLLARG